MAVSAGYTGCVYAAPGPGTVFTDEATTKNTADVTIGGVVYHAYQVYSITAQAKRYWNPAVAVVVKKNTVVITTGFTIERCGGIIKFATPNLVTDTITVSGEYLAYSKVAGIKSYSVKFGHKLADATEYNDADEVYKAINKQGSGSLTLIDVDAYLADLLGERLVFVMHFAGTYNVNDSTGPRLECYGVLSDWNLDLPVNDLVTMTHNFTMTDEWHYRSA